MIARIWKGAVRTSDGDAYADYINRTGVAGYTATPGNRGVWMLRRDVDDKTEFVMFTLWESLDAVKAFAGADYEAAYVVPNAHAVLSRYEKRAAHFELRARHLAPDFAPDPIVTRGES